MELDLYPAKQKVSSVSEYRNEFENYGKIKENPVMGRAKQIHYPLKFHGKIEDLKSTYKRDNMKLEKLIQANAKDDEITEAYRIARHELI